MRWPKCLNIVLPPLSVMLASSARRVSTGQLCTTLSITSGSGVRQPGGEDKREVGEEAAEAGMNGLQRG